MLFLFLRSFAARLIPSSQIHGAPLTHWQNLCLRLFFHGLLEIQAVVIGERVGKIHATSLKKKLSHPVPFSSSLNREIFLSYQMSENIKEEFVDLVNLDKINISRHSALQRNRDLHICIPSWWYLPERHRRRWDRHCHAIQTTDDPSALGRCMLKWNKKTKIRNSIILVWPT